MHTYRWPRRARQCCHYWTRRDFSSVRRTWSKKSPYFAVSKPYFAHPVLNGLLIPTKSILPVECMHLCLRPREYAPRAAFLLPPQGENIASALAGCGVAVVATREIASQQRTHTQHYKCPSFPPTEAQSLPRSQSETISSKMTPSSVSPLSPLSPQTHHLQSPFTLPMCSNPAPYCSSSSSPSSPSPRTTTASLLSPPRGTPSSGWSWTIPATSTTARRRTGMETSPRGPTSWRFRTAGCRPSNTL